MLDIWSGKNTILVGPATKDVGLVRRISPRLISFYYLLLISNFFISSDQSVFVVHHNTIILLILTRDEPKFDRNWSFLSNVKDQNFLVHIDGLIDYCSTSIDQYFSYIQDENKFNNYINTR